ncbi:ParA family protein [Anaerobacillus isosaccharinicus]|uniref:ParA family protein n=1 Tax=Anaerobacillus isosaccharinicus TaxID=1532552 RepID=A0A1S2LGC5_9BACI|nr:ParA family protein [Anaerobacillus isosaccharinicus]MBA5587088.1 ParA family protein [Anaerobacillus isosaccharinicus]QOY34716.1 ParA family protein [Anaerobacillus isosaccharinicus]
MKVLLCGLIKGGCGKTTTSVLVAKQLAERGFKILYIDFDSQMNGTEFIALNSSVEPSAYLEKNIFKAIQEESLKENIIMLDDKIHIIAGSSWINQFELLMNQKKVKDRHLYIRRLLGELVKQKDYDFCILDMSPSLSALNTSVQAAASHHIVTTESGYFSLKKVPEYINSIQSLQKRYNVPSTILGISICLLDSRAAFEKKVVATLKQNFNGLVFETIVRRKALLKSYTATGYPVKKYKKDIVALAEYSALTDEILVRLKMKNNKVGV